MNRHLYPPEFIAAILDTAERAKSSNPRAPQIAKRLAALSAAPPSARSAGQMQALLSELCWIIQEASGWFYGPGGSY